MTAYALRREAEATRGRANEEPQFLRAQQFTSDQGAVWDEVRRTACALETHSPTMAMADTYEAGKGDLEKILRAFELDTSSASTDTVGALVFLGGQFVCLDLLQPTKRFTRLYPKLLRGYALEALLRKPPVPKDFDPEASALRLFAEILEAHVDEQAAADLGYDLRLETKQISGSGLVWQEELIQLSLFPKVAA
jgi:hypothetical protein